MIDNINLWNQISSKVLVHVYRMAGTNIICSDYSYVG